MTFNDIELFLFLEYIHVSHVEYVIFLLKNARIMSASVSDMFLTASTVTF